MHNIKKTATTKARVRFSSPVHVWADSAELPAFNIDSEGHGQGLHTVPFLSADCLGFLPLAIALASGYTPAGPLLTEAQAQLDIASAQRQAKRLTRSMKQAGARVGSEVARDAASDGVFALVQWRGTYGPRFDSAELKMG
jgi:hypothetical protein